MNLVQEAGQALDLIDDDLAHLGFEFLAEAARLAAQGEIRGESRRS